ncbi:gamma-glutamylcyclotransferase family protein [Anatilimnocola sp. NA78]|uniref:gamma-glutamylcyclotransferase family protein n=1 Tax=Anatilimnocola sp. NA78 TaxID=3415683 RepID=UPI003CE52803
MKSQPTNDNAVRDRWYFAYGSNLHHPQLTARTRLSFTPGETSRRAFLPNYQFAFNMRSEDGEYYANLTWPGVGVPGVIYHCDANALEQLDVFEAGYQRREVVVTTQDQEAVTAWVYLALPENARTHGRPNPAYLQIILTGARDHNLSAKHISQLEALAWS